MSILFETLVFGPIKSRRLGKSLGINLMPEIGKICSFDCIYCECGWNPEKKNIGRLPKKEVFEKVLEDRLKELVGTEDEPDSITFSGNGEPTIHPDFPEIVDTVVSLRNRFYPSAKVSVLSNATMLGREKVREALRKVDNPILKLDAPDNGTVMLMNKPAGQYDVREVIGWMKEFKGDFVLQTMFLRSPEFDLSAPESLSGWMDIVRELRPREIMVYTIDRETPDKSLGKYTVQEMTDMMKPLADEGFNIQIRG